ncbi:unnamed protein product, partial [Amoebophrya sp. A25]|eukprot:GSA25T00008560001.1
MTLASVSQAGTTGGDDESEPDPESGPVVETSSSRDSSSDMATTTEGQTSTSGLVQKLDGTILCEGAGSRRRSSVGTILCEGAGSSRRRSSAGSPNLIARGNVSSNAAGAPLFGPLAEDPKSSPFSGPFCLWGSGEDFFDDAWDEEDQEYCTPSFVAEKSSTESAVSSKSAVSSSRRKGSSCFSLSSLREALPVLPEEQGMSNCSSSAFGNATGEQDGGGEQDEQDEEGMSTTTPGGRSTSTVTVPSCLSHSPSKDLTISTPDLTVSTDSCWTTAPGTSLVSTPKNGSSLPTSPFGPGRWATSLSLCLQDDENKMKGIEDLDAFNSLSSSKEDADLQDELLSSVLFGQAGLCLSPGGDEEDEQDDIVEGRPAAHVGGESGSGAGTKKDLAQLRLSSADASSPSPAALAPCCTVNPSTVKELRKITSAKEDEKQPQEPKSGTRPATAKPRTVDEIPKSASDLGRKDE